jgi:hypothetical protein
MIRHTNILSIAIIGLVGLSNPSAFADSDGDPRLIAANAQIRICGIGRDQYPRSQMRRLRRVGRTVQAAEEIDLPTRTDANMINRLKAMVAGQGVGGGSQRDLKSAQDSRDRPRSPHQQG